jgi:chromosome segregation ATPase
MAKIIEVKLPKEYENKNKYEIYTHLEQVSTYAHNLKQRIEDLEAEIKLRDSQLQKQRGDILKLKSVIGHQKIEITDLKLREEIEEIEAIIVEETKVPNFLPPSVKFETVKGNLPK